MWVWTEDRSAMINLSECFLLIIQKGGTGYGVMAYRDRGDMGTLLKVTDTEEEAQSFCNGLGASLNGQAVARNVRRKET